MELWGQSARPSQKASEVDCIIANFPKWKDLDSKSGKATAVRYKLLELSWQERQLEPKTEAEYSFCWLNNVSDIWDIYFIFTLNKVKLSKFVKEVLE